MVNDLYLWALTRAGRIGNGRPPPGRRAVHVIAEINIGSFDRNATPDGADDESAAGQNGNEKKPFILKACGAHSLPRSMMMRIVPSDMALSLGWKSVQPSGNKAHFAARFHAGNPDQCAWVL